MAASPGRTLNAPAGSPGRHMQPGMLVLRASAKALRCAGAMTHAAAGMLFITLSWIAATAQAGRIAWGAATTSR